MQFIIIQLALDNNKFWRARAITDRQRSLLIRFEKLLAVGHRV